MLSQTVNKCPGWNHEIAIGWRSNIHNSKVPSYPKSCMSPLHGLRMLLLFLPSEV